MQLRDRLTLFDALAVLTIKRAEAESRMAQVFRLEERVPVPEEDSGALHLASVLVDESKSERLSMTVRPSQAKAQSVTPLLPVFAKFRLLQ